MAFDRRRLFTELRRLDAHELRRALIFVGGLLAAQGVDARIHFADEMSDAQAVTYRLESVKCGKAECRRCPHGPYWYAYYREKGRLRSRYIGRELPASVGQSG